MGNKHIDSSKEIKNRPELPWDDSYGDHIRFIDGIFDDDICNACIDCFDDLEDKGLTFSRKHFGQHFGQQADTSIFYNEVDAMLSEPMKDINDFVHNEIIESWQIRYPIIDSGMYGGLYNAQMKMQKTRPSEGYHQWHSEGGSSWHDRNTVLAWMLYLNDIEEGGETEFLYQGVRAKPVKGRFICWPGGWTHVHRGNPPLKETKYAITGWINYII